LKEEVKEIVVEIFLHHGTQNGVVIIGIIVIMASSIALTSQ
jgi:hypothetical protein